VPDRWDAMVEHLRAFAEARAYRLAASYGLRRDDTHTYYVRSDLADADRIVEAIRSMQYYFVDAEASSVDFARLTR
jgi:hypothetical protein